eukprot:s2029_g5.t1
MSSRDSVVNEAKEPWLAILHFQERYFESTSEMLEFYGSLPAATRTDAGCQVKSHNYVKSETFTWGENSQIQELDLHQVHSKNYNKSTGTLNFQRPMNGVSVKPVVYKPRQTLFAQDTELKKEDVDSLAIRDGISPRRRDEKVHVTQCNGSKPRANSQPFVGERNLKGGAVSSQLRHSPRQTSSGPCLSADVHEDPSLLSFAEKTNMFNVRSQSQNDPWRQARPSGHVVQSRPMVQGGPCIGPQVVGGLGFDPKQNYAFAPTMRSTIHTTTSSAMSCAMADPMEGPSTGVNPNRATLIQKQIVAKFKSIRDLAGHLNPAAFATLPEEEVASLWDDASRIRAIANGILSLLPATLEEDGADVQDQELQIEEPNNPLSIFAAVRDCTRTMETREAHRKWRSACTQIICAARRAEELLQPWLLVEVFPEESDVFTNPTTQSHLQAPLEGSVTALTWSVTEETRAQGDAEAFDLPDAIAAGETEAKLQALEHKLLELQSTCKSQDDPDIAATLHALGKCSQKAGDLKKAKQHFDESLRMKRSLHGDRHHPNCAATLHALGILSQQAGHLKKAKWYFDECLRAKNSSYVERDHPCIAATLHALGDLSRQTGDLKRAKEYLDVSLQMKRSLHRGKNHPSIAATLHALGNLSRQTGDLKKAKQYLDESLRMERSLHGERDHPSFAATLHALGDLSRQAGDLKKAKQYLDESLRMERCLLGDRDHPEIAATLHALGNLSQQAGDLKQSERYLIESLRMKRSLHGERKHPDIAATLHALGDLSRQSGDLKQAKQHFEESLRMKRSLYGDRDHPDVAATLHALGDLSRHSGDLKQASQHLDESLRMKRSLLGDRDHPDIAATLHALGDLSRQTGDLRKAKGYLDLSLTMERSLHGEKDHPDIAATLHALGNLSKQAKDLDQAKQYLDESLQMKRSLHGGRDHSDIAAILHALGNLSRQAKDPNQAKQYFEESLRMKATKAEPNEAVCPASGTCGGYGPDGASAATTDTTRSSRTPLCSSPSCPWQISVAGLHRWSAPWLRHRPEASASDVRDSLSAGARARLRRLWGEAMVLRKT